MGGSAKLWLWPFGPRQLEIRQQRLAAQPSGWCQAISTVPCAPHPSTGVRAVVRCWFLIGWLLRWVVNCFMISDLVNWGVVLAGSRAGWRALGLMRLLRCVCGWDLPYACLVVVLCGFASSYAERHSHVLVHGVAFLRCQLLTGVAASISVASFGRGLALPHSWRIEPC